MTAFCIGNRDNVKKGTIYLHTDYDSLCKSYTTKNWINNLAQTMMYHPFTTTPS